MTYTDEDVRLALIAARIKYPALIVSHCSGYIILAHSEHDLCIKENHILKGNVDGFYTVFTILGRN